jgi:hypothetical protein
VTVDIEVRRAHLSDAEAIAAFVNAAQSDGPNPEGVTAPGVVERFSQVGFIVAERENGLVGLLGWQIENLIVRVTDTLVAASGVDATVVARTLVEKMEAEAKELLAESALLFLPAEPSTGLVNFWESLGYEAQCVEDLSQACREAVSEWGFDAEKVMIKRLREGPVGRPI